MKYFIGLSVLLVSIGLVSCTRVKTTDQSSDGESVVDTQTARRRKKEIMEAKSVSFPYVAQLQLLEPVEDQDVGIQAYRNDYGLDGKTLLEIEAILPDSQFHFYEAWLSDGAFSYTLLGPLTYTEPGHYFLQLAQAEDIATGSAIVVSRETVADEVPDEVIASGYFE